MTGRTLVELDRLLARIEELVALGRDRFDTDDLVRLGIERLWIYAGWRSPIATTPASLTGSVRGR